MIKTYNLTPTYYSNNSRDFQLLGHLYDAIFNYLKVEIDIIKNCPLTRNYNATLLDLVASTIGFESKHTYNSKNLYALCSTFNSLLKIKGTKKVIKDAINLLLNAQGIVDIPYVEFTNDYEVLITLPNATLDVVLLEDLFDYILPAGSIYSITFAKTQEHYFENSYKIEDEVEITKVGTGQLSQVAGDLNNTIANTNYSNIYYNIIAGDVEPNVSLDTSLEEGEDNE